MIGSGRKDYRRDGFIGRNGDYVISQAKLVRARSRYEEDWKARKAASNARLDAAARLVVSLAAAQSSILGGTVPSLWRTP